MDDLISRQAAIDRINKQREHLQPDIYPQDKIGDAAYRICAEFIERLPSAQPEQQWIPCSERMPEEIGSYPVWTAPGFGNHFSTSYWDGKEWTLRVVAWMPLPEPYKEETDDPER